MMPAASFACPVTIGRPLGLGMSENDIAGALGHTNPASARPYTLKAARKQGALRVFKALNKNRR
jgi:hypothetical protein